MCTDCFDREPVAKLLEAGTLVAVEGGFRIAIAEPSECPIATKRARVSAARSAAGRNGGERSGATRRTKAFAARYAPKVEAKSKQTTATQPKQTEGVSSHNRSNSLERAEAKSEQKSKADFASSVASLGPDTTANFLQTAANSDKNFPRARALDLEFSRTKQNQEPTTTTEASGSLSLQARDSSADVAPATTSAAPVVVDVVGSEKVQSAREAHRATNPDVAAIAKILSHTKSLSLFPRIDDRPTAISEWAADIVDGVAMLAPPADVKIAPFVRKALRALVDIVRADPAKPLAQRLRYLRSAVEGLAAKDKAHGWASGRSDGKEGVCAPPKPHEVAPNGRGFGPAPTVRLDIDHERTVIARGIADDEVRAAEWQRRRDEAAALRADLRARGEAPFAKVSFLRPTGTGDAE